MNAYVVRLTRFIEASRVYWWVAMIIINYLSCIYIYISMYLVYRMNSGTVTFYCTGQNVF